MQVNEYRQALVANNMANVDTVGFKRELALFQARYAEQIAQGSGSPGDGSLDDVGGGIMVAQTKTDFSSGPLKHTGAPTDMAIENWTEDESTGAAGAEIAVEKIDRNVIEAAARGASEGMTLLLNVVAMLIAFVAAWRPACVTSWPCSTRTGPSMRCWTTLSHRPVNCSAATPASWRSRERRRR